MPIFLGLSEDNPGGGDGGGSAPAENKPILRPAEVFSIDWTAPSGRVTHFSGRQHSLADWVATPGVTGFDMPQYTPYADQSPDIPGEINRGFRVEARDVAIPFLMYAGDRSKYRQMRTNLYADMIPVAGSPGLLTVTERDGSYRTLECFYAGGLEGNLDDSAQGQTWQQSIIEFRAPDPYWRGELREPGAAGSIYKNWFPLFPMQPAGGRALGNSLIDNDGQVDAYPIFTVTGPGTSISLTNKRTGELILITYSFDIGDKIVIDTTPDNLSVLLNGTTNLIPYMSFSTAKRRFWGLKPGTNAVDLTVAGSGAGTTVGFVYQEQFIAAW